MKKPMTILVSKDDIAFCLKLHLARPKRIGSIDISNPLVQPARKR